MSEPVIETKEERDHLWWQHRCGNLEMAIDILTEEHRELREAHDSWVQSFETLDRETQKEIRDLRGANRELREAVRKMCEWCAMTKAECTKQLGEL